MLTLFAIPRQFAGATAAVQINAIESWKRLDPSCQVLLIGDSSGVAEAARQVDVEHIDGVQVNDFGTPLLSSAFALARLAAVHPILCYVNADIILPAEILTATARVKFRDYLLTGRRVNIDLHGQIDFSHPHWEQEIRRCAKQRGSLYPPNGMDYFVFPKAGQLGYLPPFAVGRPAWDNWFIRDARQKRVPVIDLTRSVMAIHQNHSYEHVPNRRGGTAEGPEADQNRALFDTTRYYDIRNSTHAMRWGIVYPALYRRYILPVPRLIWDSRHRIRHAIRLRTRVRQLRATRLGRKSA